MNCRRIGFQSRRSQPLKVCVEPPLRSSSELLRAKIGGRLANMFEEQEIIYESEKLDIVIEKLDLIIQYQDAINTVAVNQNDNLLIIGFLLMLYFGLQIGKTLFAGK